MRQIVALGRLRAFGFLLLLGTAVPARPTSAQTPAPAEQTAPETPAEPPHPKGQIVIQSQGEPPAGQAPSSAGTDKPQVRQPADDAKVDVTDAERGALVLTSYDLDARLNPLQAGLTVRARVTVRNDGAAPLKQLPLQISSTLHWDSATLWNGAQRQALPLAQHRLDTDADHTGAAQEAVLSLPEPLARGASASLDLFYSGTVPQSGERLGRLGASTAQQQSADWDAISTAWTGLRGFGNVLWYPVAAPQLFLAEGNTLFTAVSRARLQGEPTTVRLRLSLEYTGDPPAEVYFCGRRAELKSLPDDPAAPLAGGHGIARAEFAAQPLGFRLPSLFVVAEPEKLVGGPGDTAALTATPVEASSTSSSSSGNNQPFLRERPVPVQPATDTAVIALASTDAGIAPGLGAAANRAASLLADWLGPRTLSALTVIDHEGQPFQDGPLLVAPAARLETLPETPALVYSLTHAWMQTGQPWIDEGLGQFFALLWVEREHGRATALAQLAELMQPVALAEPNISSGSETPAGEPLIAAPDELFYRRKAAAVWWMLRDVVGEKPLRAALSAWRTQAESQKPAAAQAAAFEHLLERLSGKDLGWFFSDWVLRDRGLPDLSITDVATSQTPAGPGHNTGWLVAVTVRNDGGAVADVPLTVRSGTFSTTQRVRVPGLSQITERVLVETTPSEVLVNDGSTPELRASMHSRLLEIKTQ